MANLRLLLMPNPFLPKLKIIPRGKTTLHPREVYFKWRKAILLLVKCLNRKLKLKLNHPRLATARMVCVGNEDETRMSKVGSHPCCLEVHFCPLNTAMSRVGKTGVVKLLSPRKRVNTESSRPSPSFQEEGDRESKKDEFIFKRCRCSIIFVSLR